MQNEDSSNYAEMTSNNTPIFLNVQLQEYHSCFCKSVAFLSCCRFKYVLFKLKVNVTGFTLLVCRTV